MRGKSVVESVVSDFEAESGLQGIECKFVERQDSIIAVMTLAHPTDRHYKMLNSVLEEHAIEIDLFNIVVTIKRNSTGDLLNRPEGKVFLRTLAESLNVNRYSFAKSFDERYSKSVTQAEEIITAPANHIVFGRRGAGKSMLLLFALFDRQKVSHPNIWIDAQVYSKMDNNGVIADMLDEILDQYASFSKYPDRILALQTDLKKSEISEQDIRQQLPAIRRALRPAETAESELFIFIDDFHVLNRSLQPLILDILYSVSRGNKVFIKLSAIESLTKTFDSTNRIGLEITHDVQVIKLDYNLTAPDKAASHIETILDSVANFSGIPSIRRLCGSSDVLKRLTWVAAGVPRDALYIFSQAMQIAIRESKNRVTVSNINKAASETLTIKLAEFESEVSTEYHLKVRTTLDEIRDFCLKVKKKNAFLVEVNSKDNVFNTVLALVDLRLLHVINEGVTIGESGRKYMAIVLDYGFYIGLRAARSVDLFNRQSAAVKYSQLRGLPVFRHTPANLR